MKYYLKAEWEEKYTEVTKEQYIKAERNAGFYPKDGGNGIATGGFSCGNVCGTVKYEPKLSYEKWKEVHKEFLNDSINLKKDWKEGEIEEWFLHCYNLYLKGKVKTKDNK